IASVTGQVVDWLRPAASAPPPPAVSDVEYSGVARQAAVEWLSWDVSSPQARQAAVQAVTGPGVSDSWSGTGQQWADSPSVLSVRRGAGDQAVATVRTRVVPGQNGATPTHAGARQERGLPPHAAAAPGMPQQTQPARWLTVDVPLA